MIRNEHLNEVNYLNDKTYTKESVSEIKCYMKQKTENSIKQKTL